MVRNTSSNAAVLSWIVLKSKNINIGVKVVYHLIKFRSQSSCTTVFVGI